MTLYRCASADGRLGCGWRDEQRASTLWRSGLSPGAPLRVRRWPTDGCGRVTRFLVGDCPVARRRHDITSERPDRPERLTEQNACSIQHMEFL
jgi:hypothetical protein